MLAVGGNAWAGEETITIGTNPTNSTSNSYVTTAQTFTIDGVGFAMNNFNPSSGQIRGNQSKASSNFYLYNTTAIPGTLVSVEITISSSANTFVNSKAYINTGNEAISTPATTGTNPSSGVWSDLSGTYFCISLADGGTSGTCKFSEIKITYETIDDPNLLDPELSFEQASYTARVGKPFASPTLTNKGDGTVSYTSSNVNLATVDNEGNVSILSDGEVTITAKSAKTETYKAGRASYKLTIEKALATSGIVFWKEDWRSAKADDQPSNLCEYYSQTNGDSKTKIYTSDIGAGGQSPELLIGKKKSGDTYGGSFTAKIPLNGVYGNFKLTFKKNNRSLEVTANTTSKTFTSATSGEVDFTVDKGTENAVIVFKTTTTNNVRIDDIYLFATDAKCDVTVTDAGYATFSLPKKFQPENDFALDFTGSDIKAYVASGTSGEKVNMTKVEKAPINTGLFLQGVEGQTTTATCPLTDVVSVGTNLLKPTDGTEVAASTEGKYHYVFAKQDDDLGFYNLAAPLSMTAGKAYLESTSPLTKANGAKVVLAFGDDEPTAIQSVEKTETSRNHEVYDLQGRRVQNPVKGLYIVNGKKVVLK